MANELDKKLDALLYDNWGLVHSLMERAKLIKDSVLTRSREAFESSQAFIDIRNTHEAKIVSQPASWSIGLPGVGFPSTTPISNIWIEVVTDEAQLSAKVYAVFSPNLKSRGLTRQAVKTGIPNDIRAKFNQFDPSPANATLTSTVITDPSGPEQLATRIREEVERQIELIVAAKAYIESTKVQPVAGALSQVDD